MQLVPNVFLQQLSSQKLVFYELFTFKKLKIDAIWKTKAENKKHGVFD